MRWADFSQNIGTVVGGFIPKPEDVWNKVLTITGIVVGALLTVTVIYLLVGKKKPR